MSASSLWTRLRFQFSCLDSCFQCVLAEVEMLSWTARLIRGLDGPKNLTRVQIVRA